MDLVPSNAILNHLEEREKGVHFSSSTPKPRTYSYQSNNQLSIIYSLSTGKRLTPHPSQLTEKLDRKHSVRNIHYLPSIPTRLVEKVINSTT